MLDRLLDGSAMRAARFALTGLSRRQEAISDNVANIDTPGYQRREVSFENALAASLEHGGARLKMARTDSRHLTAGGAISARPRGVTPRLQISSRSDGNTVSIDEEMALLAETQIRFQALTQGLGRRLSTLRTVIRGG